MRAGSEALKAEWPPRIADGRILSCGAFTEPDHGSDITRVNTTAVREGDK